ncbi:hypothetical protein SDC9_160624 [bioreactor metagenome]|uniref:GGDEF domain-containing protein n=1 Tax=bioreactor metagenome TaxID=1076179 RepID=A0A645FM84_9ZZZZ
MAVCEGIRDQLRVMNCPLQPELQLTASFGIAKYNRMMSAVKLFVHADIALYDAKIDRDKICIFTKEDNDRSV